MDFSPDSGTIVELSDQPGKIASIVLGGILALVLISFAFSFLYRRKISAINRHTDFREGISEGSWPASSVPIRVHGVESSNILSDAVIPVEGYCACKLSRFKHYLSNILGGSDDFRNIELTKFSFKQLEKATNNFGTLLGKGAFGPVCKAEIGRGKFIAVKQLATDSKQGEKEFKTEVMLLGRLHHRNLLSLVGYCIEGDRRLLAYEFMSNGSLAMWLHDKQWGPLSWSQRVSIAQDVARGIEYLHDGAEPPVIHRDIKAGNILLDSTMTAKVSDFGLSKEADQGMLPSAVRGSYGYVDPEYISSNTLSDKSDVYSFGVVLFEIITGLSPQQNLMDYVHQALTCNEGVSAWQEILDPRLRGECNLNELKEMALIASKCTENDPQKRPRMQSVCKALSKHGTPGPESIKIDFMTLPSWIRNSIVLPVKTDLYGGGTQI